MSEETEEEAPPPTEVRDDGCVCPVPKKKECKKQILKCPYDPRFPNQNQTKRCYFSFIDYQRCVRLLGRYPGCNYFFICYKQLCPASWVDKWFEEMENGTFPRKIYPPKPVVYPSPEDCPEAVDEEPPADIC